MKKIIMKVSAAVVCMAIGIIIVAATASSETETIDTMEQEVQTVAEVMPQPMAHYSPVVVTDSAEDPDSTQAMEALETEPVTPILEQKDVEMLAKLIWGEARGVQSKTERAAVVWCVLNRVDATGYACGGDIEWVLTYPGQFHGYDEGYPATSENIDLAIDVLMRWYAEKAGCTNTGRVLPEEFLFFCGDGDHNYFTAEYKGADYYDWSLTTPYES